LDGFGVFHLVKLFGFIPDELVDMRPEFTFGFLFRRFYRLEKRLGRLSNFELELLLSEN
jgi:hypothetical protein